MPSLVLLLLLSQSGKHAGLRDLTIIRTINQPQHSINYCKKIIPRRKCKTVYLYTRVKSTMQLEFIPWRFVIILKINVHTISYWYHSTVWSWTYSDRSHGNFVNIAHCLQASKQRVRRLCVNSCYRSLSSTGQLPSVAHIITPNGTMALLSRRWGPGTIQGKRVNMTELEVTWCSLGCC